MSAPARAPLEMAPVTRDELSDVLPVSGRVAVALFEMPMAVRRRRGARTALAFGAFAVALGMRWLADDVLPPGFPFLTFFPAVIAASFFGGGYAGALCAVLCGLAAWYWYIPPFHSFALDRSSGVAMGFYVLITSVTVALFHLLSLSVDRLLRQRREMAEMIERQRTLFAELQHRVANNLAFVSALFGLQKRRLADNPDAVAAFDDARARLDTMGRVHRRLYNPANAEMPLHTLLTELTTDLVGASDSRDIRVRVEAADIPMPLETVMTLALVVMEVVTNALKHAFVGRERGEIAITVERLDAQRCRLVIRDDGVGVDDPVALAQSRGLGMRILRSFAASLKGEIAMRREGGMVTQLDFAAPAGEEKP